MPKKWTGELVGLMHSYKITQNQLAERLNMSRQYISMILNGHRSPPGAEQRFQKAVNELITEKSPA